MFWKYHMWLLEVNMDHIQDLVIATHKEIWMRAVYQILRSVHCIGR